MTSKMWGREMILNAITGKRLTDTQSSNPWPDKAFFYLGDILCILKITRFWKTTATPVFTLPGWWSWLWFSSLWRATRWNLVSNLFRLSSRHSNAVADPWEQYFLLSRLKMETLPSRQSQQYVPPLKILFSKVQTQAVGAGLLHTFASFCNVYTAAVGWWIFNASEFMECLPSGMVYCILYTVFVIWN